MSDTRKQIAQKYLSCGGNFVPGDVEGRMQAAMSEYAAAVLEEMANIYFVQMAAETDFDYGRIKTRHDVAVDLRARAAQERAR